MKKLLGVKIKKIKYFRQDGQNYRPSGLTAGWIERGIWQNKNGFINKPMTDSYLLLENVQRYGFSKYRGGMIVLPSKIKYKNAKIKELVKHAWQKISDYTKYDIKRISKYVKKWEQERELDSLYVGGYNILGGYNIGHNFIGKYTVYSDNSFPESFGEDSITIELGGIPKEMVMMFAAFIYKECIANASSMLVKDFNTNTNYVISKDL